MNRKETMDGNRAAALAAYAFTEVAAIYPITPSTPIAEAVDEWSANGKKNIFGQQVRLIQMQSEAGAAAAMRGALQSGALASTYTASQGLLLMIPSLYKMAGELLPGVLHVTARSVAAQALSIFGDHQDVMACRQTGVALFASANVQEVQDLAIIAHLSAIKSRIPFIHFFDGFRTSHEYQKISVVDFDNIKNLIDHNALDEFRSRSLNPEHPTVRGTTQNPDIYFQQREGANIFYNAVADIVTNYMEGFGKETGRNYKLFDYYGSAEAEYVIVAMGSVCDTIDSTVDYLNAKGEKTGAVRVRLYRPFSETHFLQSLPRSVKKIAVLDRTKEPGSPGEPLYLDIVKALKNTDITVVGGRYGLSSKDTRPGDVAAVFRNIMSTEPKEGFTIGIVDDVTNTSLPEEEIIDITPEGTVNCKIWGLGSDGTVGSNKSAIKIIGDHTDLEVQAYFSYDSKKSGGTTVSHLRFGPKPLRSPYLVYDADYIACHNTSFIYQFDLLKGIKNGGTFVLVSPWSTEELEEKLPARLKKSIAERNIKFYTIDAMKIASEVGLGNRINMVMQAVFFKLANIIPYEEALKYLKASIEKMYGKKGRDIVEKNYLTVDKGANSLTEISLPEDWKNTDEAKVQENLPDFVSKIQQVMARHEGDRLPVSVFSGMEDGTFPSGTTKYEKRGIAPSIPEWQINNCIQCNQCSFICPHSTIRPFLLDDKEFERKPSTFNTKKAVGKEISHLHYRIQISPLDCTGCGNCADICPATAKALIMKPAEQQIEAESDNWEFTITVSDKKKLVNIKTLKGSQFAMPYLEFNGACPGCGEPAYIKLLTQLFGDRMMISNATGCSSIWGASTPSIAYSTDRSGKGPAWINPLFEDAAEFGLGMLMGVNHIRGKIAEYAAKAIGADIDENLKGLLNSWINAYKMNKKSDKEAAALLEAIPLLSENSDTNIEKILQLKDFLVKKSVWAIGGDGWAYDIGYGGLDHVLASGEDINIFVLDTELYSNTGGQCSKSTPFSAVAKLAAAGKRQRKKDIGLMAMTYGNVYVAQIAIGADMNQTIKAVTEAESYNGPSLIIAYSPCISHGIKSGMGSSIKEEKRAVQSGYWHLYRYNPSLKDAGDNPFILDSKEPKADYIEFIKSELRYSQLNNVFPETAPKLYEVSEVLAKERYDRYRKLFENKLL